MLRRLLFALALGVALGPVDGPARADAIPEPKPDASATPTPDPVPAPDPTATPAPTPAAEPAATPAKPAPVTVIARLAPLPGQVAGDVKLGAERVLEIVATAPRDATLYPPFRPALGSFRVVETLAGTEKIEGATRTETWRFAVVPLRLGVEKIPKIEIPYKLADGTQGQAETPIVRVRILGFLENEQDPAPGALPPPNPVIATNWALIWGLSIGGALALAALLTFFVLKALENRFKALMPAPPPRPANEVALEALERIEQATAAELDGAARLAATIDTLRAYLQGRYQIDALEMTTRELVKALDEVDLKSISPKEIESLLEDTDLVKFARLTPKEEEARATAPVVRKIVLDTWEPPKVEVEEIARLEPATLRQRYYAAGLDLGVALALSALVVGGAVIAGGSLAFLGLVIPVVGVFLALRDLFGRSPGKAMLGTTVVTRSDKQPAADTGRLVRRNLLYLVWPLTLPLEALVLRKHPLGLRLGDLWAETEVVLAGSRAPATTAPAAPAAGGGGR